MEPVDFSHLDLGPLLNPRSVGVIGVSERSTRGTRALANLKRHGFDGNLYPINPKYSEILELPCYPDVEAVPEKLDTLLVAVPGAHVPDILKAAKKAGTRSAVVLSSGFRESGPVGMARHEQLQELAMSGMPICGPNCFGVVNLATGATVFSGVLPDPLRSGSVAVVSQSGGFTSLVSNTLIEQRGLGVKYMISCGNQAGATVEDYLQYLVRDDDVRTIACYAEGLRSATRLRSIGEEAREAGKDIVILKSGHSASAVAAVASHTGSVAGSAKIAAAALREAGFIQAECLDEFIEIVSLVATGDSRRIGRRIVIVSGGGGETSHGSDAAERSGVELPELEPRTIASLKEILPDFANPRNPLDLTGSMYEDPTLFPASVKAVLDDHNVDLMAVNLGLRRPKNPGPSRSAFVDLLTSLDESARSRILAYGSLSTGPVDTDTITTLREAGIPSSVGSDYTLRAIAKTAARNERFAEVEARPPATPDATTARPLPLRRGASVAEEWSVLSDFGLPLVASAGAADPDAAAKAAVSLGFPVSLKTASLAVAHKSDVGGVALNLHTEDEVRAAYDSVVRNVQAATSAGDADQVVVQEMARPGVEMLLGITRDPALGLAVVVGMGGLFVEILDDTAVCLPPVAADDAAAAIRGLKGFPLLNGGRGTAPADITALANLVVSLSELCEVLPDEVTALDLNPVIVHPDGEGVSCVDVWIGWSQ